ncbi:MAG: LacI family DNA-binding transcriptional regulator [Velocimicrobium sp.]
MATIKELAKLCDVSIATVSNVLNGTGRVGEETSRKILDTAKKIGYIPNMMAKNLKQKVTKTIGIITEDLTVFNCADIVDGINDYLDQVDYTFLLGNLRLYKKYNNMFYHHEGYKAQVEEEFQIMKSKQVAGIIYVGAHSREIKSIPKNFDLPIVVAYGYASEQHVPSVIYDDEKGAYEAVSKLIQLGNTSIGVVTGEQGSLHTIERMKGYQRALFEHKILCDPSLIVEGDWTVDSGYEAGKKLIEKGVSAIFSMSDVMASGIYDCANEKEIIIGKELDLIGFDDRQICTAFRPTLTSMALPLEQIGQHAGKIIVEMIEHKTIDTSLLHKIECRLIERNSIKG